MAVQLIILLVFGVITAMIANNKGRSAVGWFFVGFFLGLIGLIIVCVVSDLKQQALRETRLRAENRRLRERMRKDRAVSDQRYRQVNRRLKAHDSVMEIDTESQDPALEYTESDIPEPEQNEENPDKGEEDRETHHRYRKS